MAKTDYKSVDQYVRAQPVELRAVLELVRSTIVKAMPGAEEVISYQIPAYKLNGRLVLFFAGWKEHFSIYPATGPLAQVFATELAKYEVSKGTIRFPLEEKVPVGLIGKIARFRAREAKETAAARQKEKAAKKASKAVKAPARTTKKTAKAAKKGAKKSGGQP